MTAVLPELDVDGPGAPPRSNGELVFAEPWQGRAFGLVMALIEKGVLSYDAFRDALVERIATQEQASPTGQSSYYRCWLEALEQVLAEADVVSAADLDARTAAFAARLPGHDHGDGDHDHGHGDHDD